DHGDHVRNVSVPAETLRRWRLSRPGVSPRRDKNNDASECRNRQALGSCQRLCRLAKAMGRGTNIRMARAVQTARQGLGKSQSQGARVSASRLHQAHVEKAMQSRMVSPDRLLGGVITFSTVTGVSKPGPPRPRKSPLQDVRRTRTKKTKNAATPITPPAAPAPDPPLPPIMTGVGGASTSAN